MDFTDVINDLIKMEGLRLNSIRPGAEIVIEKVDVEQKRLTIRNASGKTQNRYFAELERIWEALLANPAIRVEDVLNGSGSSRNQPETIFANLPYIEWLKVDNKKHIAYVEKITHSYGTLRKMDAAAANNLVDKFAKNEVLDVPVVIVAADDIAVTAKKITDSFGVAPAAISEGFYEFKLKTTRIILACAETIGIPKGSYSEVKAFPRCKPMSTIRVAEKYWAVYRLGELGIIVPR